jgi:hypothetical protein
MAAIFNKIPGWGWALITLILLLTLASHVLTNPIVHGRMICANPDLKPCGKIRVVMSEGGHEFFSETKGDRGFFVVPVFNRLKVNHPVHLFLVEKLGERETEIPIGGPISISFSNVMTQSEIQLTVSNYNITKIDYEGGNVFSLIVHLYEMAENSVSNLVGAALRPIGNGVFVSQAQAGDITDLSGFLEIQRSINSPAGSQAAPAPDILIGQSAGPIGDPALEAAIQRAVESARNAQEANSLPLSVDGMLRASVERQTGFSIPDNHWREIESPAGLATYLNARAALAKKHPDLFAPHVRMNWGEAASRADGIYGEKYIFLPEATIDSLNVQ